MNSNITKELSSHAFLVMPSVFGYRFKITSKQNKSILGTGLFKSSRKMTKEEQIDFLHQYTNGNYQNKESFVNIDIFEKL